MLFYEKSTGFGALEMLVNKYTRIIIPEMGPNIMWKTKYGHMGAGCQTITMTVTLEQAKNTAQQWLNTNLLGTTAGYMTTFYGY